MAIALDEHRAPRTGLDDARRVLRHARVHSRGRTVSVTVGLAVATFVAFCVSISVGDFPIPLVDVVPAVFGFGDPDSDFIIRTLRLPRAVNGLLVGIAFGMSGTVFQTMARNPLASPDVIGITQGASFSAVLVIVLVGGSSTLVAGSALFGALAVSLAVYALAYRQGVSSYRLVLVGIGVGAVAMAGTEYLLTRADLYDAQRAFVWLTGSLNGRGWDQARPLAAVLLVLLPVLAVLSRPLRGIQLGDDTAKALGVSVERSKVGLILTAVALAAVATAAAGPIAFVAFVSGPIARRMTRSSGLSFIPTALVGALVVLLSDLVGRRLFAPTELPVGVITGIIGAPYLLWLLARSNKVGSGG
ncbi:MAG: iron chelate uptake ABC transporter family permease subunit [Actinomycetota bacterium]|nr:iron chelate uptake ABC transporter family permease subunit [Actinomycetota bacterium]